jgi:hypothetical protein
MVRVHVCAGEHVCACVCVSIAAYMCTIVHGVYNTCAYWRVSVHTIACTCVRVDTQLVRSLQGCPDRPLPEGQLPFSTRDNSLSDVLLWKNLTLCRDPQ